MDGRRVAVTKVLDAEGRESLRYCPPSARPTPVILPISITFYDCYC